MITPGFEKILEQVQAAGLNYHGAHVAVLLEDGVVVLSYAAEPAPGLSIEGARFTHLHRVDGVKFADVEAVVLSSAADAVRGAEPQAEAPSAPECLGVGRCRECALPVCIHE